MAERVFIEPPGWLTDPEARAKVKQQVEKIWPVWKWLMEYDAGMHPEADEESQRRWGQYFEEQARLAEEAIHSPESL